MEGEQANPVKASDITVLVRSRQEAALIRDALTLLDIPSVYLSNRDSVFDTLEAREMLWLLQAVLAPEREKYASKRAGQLYAGFERARY